MECHQTSHSPGSVENSNLHALNNVDYVIVSTPVLMAAADSLATLHASTGLRVAVVPQQDVFNAFSAGVSDPTAIKMLMMMLNDRAEQSMGVVAPPQHLLLMGDASYENRNLQGNGDIIVGHYSLESLQTTTSYISDDYYALIEEGQGEASSRFASPWRGAYSDHGCGFGHGGGGEDCHLHGVE